MKRFGFAVLTAIVILHIFGTRDTPTNPRKDYKHNSNIFLLFHCMGL